MTDYTIPRANAPIAGQDAPTIQWYNFLRYLDTRTSSATGDVQAEITIIAEKLGSPDGTVDNIPSLGSVTSVQGKQSIVSSGIGVVQLRLVNDQENVDPVYYYGTDSTGTKGYNLLYSAFASTANIAKINTAGIVSFDLTDLADSGTGALLATTFDAKGRKTGTKAATITGTAGRITVVNGDAVAGLPTIDLATVTDAGGGTLQRIAFDAYGRKTGTSAATTDDLAEGATNLYFTDARVLATTLTGLSTATATPVVDTDAVLIGIGKLQGQATANATAIAAKEPAIAPGTTSDYWRGDKSWQTLDKSAVGLANVDNTSDVNKPVSTAQAAADALKLDKSIPAGYIDGLKMVWNSGTSISLTSGACYIQSLAAVISFPSTLTLSSLSLTASTFYHLYGYLNSGTPAIELVTTAPETAYSGTARSKTGDTSRRYIGSVKTSPSGDVYSFLHTSPTTIIYQVNTDNPPFIVVSNGGPVTATTVSTADVVPVTGTAAMMTILNATTNTSYLMVSNSNGPVVPGGWIVFASPNGISTTSVPLDSAQAYTYAYQTNPVSLGSYQRVFGYVFER